MSAWIEMIPDEAASPALREALEKARTPAGTVDNVMRVHSLRPASMLGHIALYKAALHDPTSTLPLWFLEVVGSYTSMLNACAYSVTNHWHNAAHLIGDKARAAKVHAALTGDAPEAAFKDKELALLLYTRKLTLHPGKMTEADVEACRKAGATDAEILEVNQVCGYFSYANRCLNGLGVTLEGDTVGYYGHDPETDKEATS